MHSLLRTHTVPQRFLRNSLAAAGLQILRNLFCHLDRIHIRTVHSLTCPRGVIVKVKLLCWICNIIQRNLLKHFSTFLYFTLPNQIFFWPKWIASLHFSFSYISYKASVLKFSRRNDRINFDMTLIRREGCVVYSEGSARFLCLSW